LFQIIKQPPADRRDTIYLRNIGLPLGFVADAVASIT
jgi:hypothetical protein